MSSGIRVKIQNQSHVYPGIDELVGHTLQSRRVTCVDMGCNGTVILIGVAMIVFAAIIWTHHVHEHGWIMSKAPIYVTMGLVGILGFGITIVSIKRFVETYQKWSQFRTDVSDVT